MLFRSVGAGLGRLDLEGAVGGKTTTAGKLHLEMPSLRQFASWLEVSLPAGKGLGFYTGAEDGYLYVDNLRVDDVPEPEREPGEVLLETLFVSVDPAMRVWISENPGYVQRIDPGDTMRGSQILGASIVDSHNRWVTIHGTEYLVVRDCVGFKSVGHGYFTASSAISRALSIIFRACSIAGQRRRCRGSHPQARGPIR